MKIMRLTTMLLLAAMAGASCTSNAKNNEENNNQENGSVQEVAVATADVASEDSICNNPDVRPQYDAKDQMSFLLNFLNKNQHYPEEASKNGIDGTVNVQMVVEKDGTPTNFDFIRQVDPLLDAEAMRVAKLLPKFKPGMKDGKPVRCLFIFSVPFRCK